MKKITHSTNNIYTSLLYMWTETNLPIKVPSGLWYWPWCYVNTYMANLLKLWSMLKDFIAAGNEKWSEHIRSILKREERNLKKNLQIIDNFNNKN